MVRTRVGYAGGTTPSPTYDAIGDHTETVEVDYDPAVIGYADLLEVFWGHHSPCRRGASRQYQAVVFVHDDEQAELARASRAEAAERLGRPLDAITTEVRPSTGFTLAEDYHQKFYLQGSDVFAELEARYGDMAALVRSTAGARLNGYLGGHGTRAQLERDLERLDLSEEAEALLRRRVGD